MTSEAQKRRRRLLTVVGAGSFVLLLVGLSLLGEEIGPEVPLKVAIGLLAAAALVASLLAIPRAENEVEPAVLEDDATPRPSGEAEVVSYRAERLLALGVPDELVRPLAVHQSVRVHDVAALVARGCPPATAARIVWPA